MSAPDLPATRAAATVAPVGLTQEDAERVAGALSTAQAANTRRNYRKEARSFAAWCADRGLESLPATPDTGGAYLAHLAAAGKMMATIRGARAGIADAHRQAGHEDAAAHPGVKQVMAGLARQDPRPQSQARPLTAEALAAIRPPPAPPGAAEAAALRWGDVELGADGTARVLVTRSKTDAEGEGKYVFLGESAVLDLLAIRPEAAVIDAAAPVFGLGVSQLGRRIRQAAKAAGLGDGFSGHSGRVGMAQDLASAGVEMPLLMEAGRWKSPTMPAHYTARQAAGRGAVAKYYREGRPQG